MLETRGFKIYDLFEDLKDGFALYNLCEVNHMFPEIVKFVSWLSQPVFT